MLWLFTCFGAIAGALMASIPGLLLGALLGHVLDRRLHLSSWADLWQRLWPRKTLNDEALLFLMLGRLAKVNGRVLPVHIEQARAEMQRLCLDEAAQRQAIEAFSQGKTGRDNLRPLLRVRAAQGEALLRAAWRMAWVDQQVPRAERELLLLWGKWLGFSAQQVEQLGREYAPRARQPAAAGGAYQAALRLLGVSGDSDAEQVKRAYRRLLSKHHPDKLEGSGANAERIREATEMTRQLHQAYALIRQRRGFR